MAEWILKGCAVVLALGFLVQIAGAAYNMLTTTYEDVEKAERELHKAWHAVNGDVNRLQKEVWWKTVEEVREAALKPEWSYSEVKWVPEEPKRCQWCKAPCKGRTCKRCGGYQ